MSTLPQASFQAIIDPVLRFVQSLDDNDRNLFTSSLTQDATFDPTSFNNVIPPPAQPFKISQGLETIANGVLAHVGSDLDTTHVVSNVRVTRKWMEGNSELREVTAYALAQHFTAGEGLDTSKKGCLMGNRYRVEVIRMPGEVDEVLGEDRWRIRLFVVWNQWSEGDASVMGRAWK